VQEGISSRIPLAKFSSQGVGGMDFLARLDDECIDDPEKQASTKECEEETDAE
jgi:hypothetical protein